MCDALIVRHITPTRTSLYVASEVHVILHPYEVLLVSGGQKLSIQDGIVQTHLNGHFFDQIDLRPASEAA